MPSENEVERKIRELNGSPWNCSYKEPPFKDSTKVLNDTGKKSEPIYKKLFNTLWQQKEPLDKLKDEMSIKLLNA